MSGTTEGNQRRREAQRAKILAAARKVFALKGRAATMADIAAAADISQGLAYRYFESKEAIFHELVERVAGSIGAALQSIMERPGTPGERLAFLVAVMLENDPERLEIYQLFYNLATDEATPDDLREFLRRLGLEHQAVLRELIVQGQATGEVAPDDPEQLLAAITACTRGLSQWALRNPEQYQKRAPKAEIILRMLKPHAEGREPAD